MLDVIAFFFAGRFNSTRSMLAERSVIISSIVHSCSALFRARLAPLRRTFLCFRLGAARAQAVDFLVLKPSCWRTSSLCSPSSGARLAGTFATPCT